MRNSTSQAGAFKRVAMLAKHVVEYTSQVRHPQLGGMPGRVEDLVNRIELPPGHVFELAPDLAEDLIARGVADDSTAAIAAMLDDAADELERVRRRQVARNGSWIGFELEPAAHLRRAEARCIVRVIEFPPGAVTLSGRKRLAPAAVVKVSPISEHQQFREAQQLLEELQAESRRIDADADRFTRELVEGPPSAEPTSMMDLAMGTAGPLESPFMKISTGLQKARERQFWIRQVIQQQSILVSRKHALAAATETAKLLPQRAAIASSILGALETLRKAHADEQALREALRLAGYGIEPHNALSLVPILDHLLEVTNSEEACRALVEQHGAMSGPAARGAH